MLFSDLPTNSAHNRQALASIVAHYAVQVGIAGNVGVQMGDTPGSHSPAHTLGDNIYVNIKGGISPLLNDFNNLKSALRHEKDHKENHHSYWDISNIDHANTYLVQVQSATFNKTTKDFKEGMVGSIAKYLTNAAMDAGGSGGSGDFTEVNATVAEFNKQSAKTGYTFQLVQTAGSGMNIETYKYEVQATPVAQAPAKKSKK